MPKTRAKRLRQQHRKIKFFWDAVLDAEPDISTERAMIMTAERATRYFKREIDVSDVGDALYEFRDDA